MEFARAANNIEKISTAVFHFTVRVYRDNRYSDYRRCIATLKLKKFLIIRDNKIAKLRINVYSNAIQIGDKLFYYPNLSERIFNSFIAIEITQNQLVIPTIQAIRIEKNRAQKIEILRTNVEKLKQLRDEISIRKISKHDCKMRLEALIPHGFRIQNESHAVKFIDADINNITMLANGNRLRGGIDTGTTITIFRKIPTSAQKIRSILVNTVNGIKEKPVFKIQCEIDNIKTHLEIIEGDIPCDFYLSPGDANKFKLFIQAKRAVEVNDS